MSHLPPPAASDEDAIERSIASLIDYRAAVVAAVNQPRELIAHLGSQEASHVLERCIARLLRVVESHGGQILDTNGWTVTALFPDLKKASDAAYSMRRRTSELPAVAQRKLTISVGVGPSPMQALAQFQATSPDTISISTETTRPSLHTPLPRLGSLLLEPGSKPSDQKNGLKLRYRGKTLLLNAESKEITLGRGPECDLQVNSALASRIHARICRKGNHFSLIDESTNGTFLRQENVSVLVHKRIVPLGKSGQISLGAIFEQAADHALDFEFHP